MGTVVAAIFLQAECPFYCPTNSVKSFEVSFVELYISC